MVVFDIPVENVKPNPRNPRKDLGDLEELKASIRKNGIRQNLTVIEILDENGEYSGDYRIIAGHRRYAAAVAVGMKQVPCHVIQEELSEGDEIMAMLEENMQRQNLTVAEEGQAVQLCLDLGVPMESLEKKTGLSAQTLKHRVEIAKLDQETLEEKDKNFQLNLHSLYYLEKIKDINKRNEIISKATDNNGIKYLAEQAAKEERNKENKDAITEFLRHKGVFPGRDGLTRWSDGWECILEIDYSDSQAGKKAREGMEEVAEKYDLDSANLNYIFSTYGNLIFIMHEKDETEEEEEDPEQVARAEKYKKEQADKKALGEAIESWKKGVKEFTLGIINGKYSGKVLQRIVWDLLVRQSADIDADEAIDMISGSFKIKDEISEEELTEMARRKFAKLDTTEQMLLFMILNLRYTNPVGWRGDFNADSAEECMEAVEILEGYGYMLSDEERELFDGTHPCYKREEDE